MDVRKHFVPRMHDLIIDTILSSKKQFLAMYRENQFELFGFDFLIDEDFRTWLIEVRKRSSFSKVLTKYIVQHQSLPWDPEQIYRRFNAEYDRRHAEAHD